MEFHVFFVHGTIYSLIFCLIYTLIYIHAAQVHRNLRGAGCPTDPDPSLERSADRYDRNWSGFTHQKGREKVGFNWQN